MAKVLTASLTKALEQRDEDLTMLEKEAAEKRAAARRERREALAKQRDIVTQAAKTRDLLSDMEKIFTRAGLSRLFHGVALGRECNPETGQTVSNHVNVSLGNVKHSIYPRPVTVQQGNEKFRKWEYSIVGKNISGFAESDGKLVQNLGYWASRGISRKDFNRLKTALG